MPPGPPNRQQGAVAGLFRAGARLNPGQVTDARVPYEPMDVWKNGGAGYNWEPTSFPGGISPNPDVVLVRPGPQGSAYFPHAPSMGGGRIRYGQQLQNPNVTGKPGKRVK